MGSGSTLRSSSLSLSPERQQPRQGTSFVRIASVNVLLSSRYSVLLHSWEEWRAKINNTGSSTNGHAIHHGYALPGLKMGRTWRNIKNHLYSYFPILKTHPSLVSTAAIPPHKSKLSRVPHDWQWSPVWHFMKWVLPPWAQWCPFNGF